MNKQNEQTLKVINEVGNKAKPLTYEHSDRGQCTKKIDCCGGKKPGNAVRIRPRTAIFVGIVLGLWVIWNKYYRKSS